MSVMHMQTSVLRIGQYPKSWRWEPIARNEFLCLGTLQQQHAMELGQDTRGTRQGQGKAGAQREEPPCCR